MFEDASVQYCGTINHDSFEDPVLVTLSTALKTFKFDGGPLEGVEEKDVKIKMDGQSYTVAYGDIQLIGSLNSSGDFIGDVFRENIRTGNFHLKKQVDNILFSQRKCFLKSFNA